MKNRIIIPFTVFLILSTLILLDTATAESVVGVLKGETFDYTYDIFWASSNPSAVPPALFTILNDTQTVQLKIDSISGSKLGVIVTERFSNGSHRVLTGFIDTSSGLIEAPYGFLIIGSNLAANELMYPSGGHQTITSSYSRSYVSGPRETNRYLSETESERTEIDFDKVKGISVAYSYQTTEITDGYTVTIKEVMANTNFDVWIAAPPPPTPGPTSQRTATPTQSAFPTVKGTPTSTQQPDSLIPIAVLVVVIIIVVVVALLLVRGRGRRRKSRVDEEFAQYLKPKKP